MSTFQFLLPETSPSSRKTDHRILQEDIQDDSIQGVGDLDNVNNNENDDIFVEDDDDLDFDTYERILVASNLQHNNYFQPTTPTTTLHKPPPHHPTALPITIPMIAKPPSSGAKSIPTSFTTPTTDLPVATASSYPSPPSLLTSARFIVSPAQARSSDTATVSPSQWVRGIKLPSPPTASASVEERGSRKSAAYVKGGYAERLVSLIGKESSDHTIWAHGLSRRANQPSTTRPRTPIPTLYKVLSKQVAHATIYTRCEAVADHEEGTDQSRVIVFSPVYSTYDEAEADKIEVGKVLQVWRPWIEIKNADEDGTWGTMIVTRFRVLEGEEAGGDT
ncbi:hypothetical protein BC937DRAFT_93953 [Endogone sp. FLAS-F59071]|nr:hypothetical protein BC937DRAFT_93953 [Endogone sp. FLAS-F59071]|eukprot:RUS20963.1 hypothetical protein BC937DRAFT_93953 [Endogone sp. FLAS-F59071]